VNVRIEQQAAVTDCHILLDRYGFHAHETGCPHYPNAPRKCHVGFRRPHFEAYRAEPGGSSLKGEMNIIFNRYSSANPPYANGVRELGIVGD